MFWPDMIAVFFALYFVVQLCWDKTLINLQLPADVCIQYFYLFTGICAWWHVRFLNVTWGYLTDTKCIHFAQFLMIFVTMINTGWPVRLWKTTYSQLVD